MPNRHTSYRVLNRNGRVIYFEDKRTPIYNDGIKNNAEEVKEIIDVSKKAKEDSKSQKISEDLALESSAYTLRSVVDTVVKDDDIEQLAKTIDKNKKAKTIRDFDIPESYFNTKAPNATELEKKQQEAELALRQDDGKKGIFARLYDKYIRGNDKTEEIEFERVEKETKVADTKNKKSQQEVKTGEVIFNKNQKTGKSDATYARSGKKETKQDDKKEDAKNAKNAKDTNKDTNYKLAGTLNTTKTSSAKSRTTTKSTKDVNIINTPLKKNKYYIQMGSFGNDKNAARLLQQFANVGTQHYSIETKTSGGKKIYRVVIGTFDTKAAAEKEMEKILEKGHFDCYVFKN